MEDDINDFIKMEDDQKKIQTEDKLKNNNFKNLCLYVCNMFRLFGTK